MNYEELFKMFVGHEEMRPFMLKPFKQKGMYFATDAHSMIFMPTDKADLNFEEQEKPDCHKIIPKQSNCNILINIAELKKQLVPVMVDETKKCTHCDGEGVLECDLGHNHDCDQCNGDGEWLTGGKVANPQRMYMFYDVLFTYFELNRLIKACELMEVTEITKTYGEAIRANLFTCGEVKILVMPCNNYHSDEFTPINL